MKKRQIMGACLTAALLTGCVVKPDVENPAANTTPQQTTPQETAAETETEKETEEPGLVKPVLQRPEGEWDAVIEAEDQTMTGNVKAVKKNGYSGTGYATGLHSNAEGAEDIMTFAVDVPYEYFYDLNFLTQSGGAHKVNFVLLDGQSIGEITTESKEMEDTRLDHIYMSAGKHEIAIKTSWGYIDVDCLKLSLGEAITDEIYEIPYTLIDKDATDNTKRLMSYLIDQYGKAVLTGQYCEKGAFGTEMRAIWTTTGDYPAMIGLDMTGYSGTSVAHGSKSTETELAVQYYKERGGIVTFCWHWTSPEKYVKGNWYSSFYTSSSTLDLAKIMNGEDPEGYEALMADIDGIAAQLKVLQDEGVPVLWRPLHEASGGWFWWGAAGAKAYKKLWVTMYDKLTKEHGLHNLIWVWNGQAKDWYPGDEYVDIIGEDIYPGKQVTSSQVGKFLEANAYTTAKKMVVLSENGCIFDIEEALRDNVLWGYYGTWQGEFVIKSAAGRYSEEYTSAEVLKKMYESPFAINLSELPDLTTYPIHEGFGQ